MVDNTMLWVGMSIRGLSGPWGPNTCYQETGTCNTFLEPGSPRPVGRDIGAFMNEQLINAVVAIAFGDSVVLGELLKLIK